MDTILDGSGDAIADRRKMVVDSVIGDPQDLQSIGRKPFIPAVIMVLLVIQKMDLSVDFDHEPCRCTVKIHNKGFDDSLLIDFNRIIFQKRIPKFSFLRGHIMPQVPGSFKHLQIFDNTFFVLHRISTRDPLSLATARQLPQRGSHWQVG